MAACLVALVAIAGVGFGSSGCTDSTADEITPVTGIVLRADGLFVDVGCGEGATQVYRYVGVVADPSNNNQPVPNAVGVYACYADGNFDLPSPDATNYVLRVYAFDKAAYDLAGGDTALLGTAGDDKALRALRPTYLTSCSASQQENIEVLAVCAPLVAYGIDASVVTSASDAALDGAQDGDSDATAADASNATDASDASSGDASDGGAKDSGDASDAGDAALDADAAG